MTVQQLKNKHKRERRIKKRRMVINGILTVVSIAIMVVGIELCFRAWEQEQNAQTQRNIEWQAKYYNR